MDVLNDRVGENNGIKQLMRERLNAKGDKVILHECDVVEIIENTNALVDMVRVAHRRLDEAEAREVDNTVN